MAAHCVFSSRRFMALTFNLGPDKGKIVVVANVMLHKGNYECRNKPVSKIGQIYNKPANTCSTHVHETVGYM